jgi:hypothetical protein
MKKIVLSLIAFTMTSVSAIAGGILTNTNQSVLFLKNPARDAAIGLDGVYSNPAGVAFMPEGFHVAFNWQYAHQTRTITSTNPVFALGKKNEGKTMKEFRGWQMPPSFHLCRLPTTKATGAYSSTSLYLAVAVLVSLLTVWDLSKAL